MAMPRSSEFEARTPLSRAWNCTGRTAAVDDLGLSVRKLWRGVAEKLQSRRGEPAHASRWDHRSVVGAEYRAAEGANHLRTSWVDLMASPSSLVNGTNGTILL